MNGSLSSVTGVFNLLTTRANVLSFARCANVQQLLEISRKKNSDETCVTHHNAIFVLWNAYNAYDIKKKHNTVNYFMRNKKFRKYLNNCRQVKNVNLVCIFIWNRYRSRCSPGKHLRTAALRSLFEWHAICVQLQLFESVCEWHTAYSFWFKLGNAVLKINVKLKKQSIYLISVKLKP